MLILSRIIAQAWFKSLFACLVVLFLLLTVGDIINGFLRGYEFNRILLEYVLKMPFLMGKLLPVCALLSTLFSLNSLKAHSELVGILAAGYSSKRFYLLIFLFSLVVALLQFLNVGFIQPKANQIKRQEFEKSSKKESRYLARSKVGNSGVLWYKSQGYFSSFTSFDTSNNVLSNINLYFISEQGLLESIVKAKSATYESEGLWRLKDLKLYRGLSHDNFPVQTTESSLLIALEEQPEDFVQFKSDITTLNIFELNKFVNRLKETGINYIDYQIMFFEMISNCLICVLFALFPMASIFNPNRRNSSFGKNIVIVLLFSIIFWVVYSGSIAAGNSEKLPPLVAAFALPFIFSLIIGRTFLRNRKL